MEHTLYLIGQDVSDLKGRVARLESLVDIAKHHGKRLLILLTLWSGVVLGALNSEASAKFVVQILKGLIKS